MSWSAQVLLTFVALVVPPASLASSSCISTLSTLLSVSSSPLVEIKRQVPWQDCQTSVPCSPLATSASPLSSAHSPRLRRRRHQESASNLFDCLRTPGIARRGHFGHASNIHFTSTTPSTFLRPSFQLLSACNVTFERYRLSRTKRRPCNVREKRCCFRRQSPLHLFSHLERFKCMINGLLRLFGLLGSEEPLLRAKEARQLLVLRNDSGRLRPFRHSLLYLHSMYATSFSLLMPCRLRLVSPSSPVPRLNAVGARESRIGSPFWRPYSNPICCSLRLLLASLPINPSSVLHQLSSAGNGGRQVAEQIPQGLGTSKCGKRACTQERYGAIRQATSS